MNFIPWVSALIFNFLQISEPQILGRAISAILRKGYSFKAFTIISTPSGAVTVLYPESLKTEAIFRTVSGFEWATSIFFSSRFLFAGAAGFLSINTVLHLGHLNFAPPDASLVSSTLSRALHLGHITTTSGYLLGSQSL